MAAGWTRLVTLVALIFLALHAPCAADDDDAPAEDAEEEPVEIADAPADEEEPTHNEEEWKDLQKRILDSFPDEAETDDHEEMDMTDEMKEAARRGRRATNSKGQSFPFLQYNGELADSDKLHMAVMTVYDAKIWCVEETKCVGFSHVGDPTDEPVEMHFKDKWNLHAGRMDETWTSYQRGEMSEQEVEEAHRLHCEIHASEASLNEHKEVKRFVKKHASAYGADVTIVLEDGKTPELICYRNHEVVSNTPLTSGQSAEKIHVLVQDHGVTRVVHDEM